MMEEKCRCGLELEFIETPNLVHYGKLVCPKHGFIKWTQNPKKIGTRTKTSNYEISEIMAYHKFLGEPFCFNCLRTKEQLGIKETLTIDHIRELDKDGEDIIENLQILCSACHKLKNWARLYLNWHLCEKND